MSEAICLNIESRDESKNPRQLRAAGFLPATIYGKGIESVSVQLDKRNFVNNYKKNKEAVFELKASDKTYKAVVQNLQMNYSTQEELNIEFKTV